MGIKIKSEEEIKLMYEGGQKLARIKKVLKKEIRVGVNAKEIDDLAENLIKEEGGEPSFKMVKGYNWTTCINIGKGVVHGIPKKEIVFQKGDLVSLDTGIFYKGFHTDSSFSITLEPDSELTNFLKVGENALKNSIKKVIIGNYIYDISKAIEDTLKRSNLNPVRALVGHGVGKDLHEDPQIPCFVFGKRENSPKIVEGMVLAIEVMYSNGSGDIVLENDGWTISTQDGKISALFEDSIAVTKKGSLLLTA
jgi:methionyl aminopeptidase